MANKSLGVLQIFCMEDHILDKSIFPLRAGENFIGSTHVCDIFIPDKDIEEMAFKITISEDGGDYGIEDMNSKLGLYKAGNDNTRQKLKPNKEYEFSSDKPIFIGDRYKCLLITKSFKKENEKIKSSPAVDESQNSHVVSQNDYNGSSSRDHFNEENLQTQPLATLQQDFSELDNYHVNSTPQSQKKVPALKSLISASDFKNSLHDDDDEEEDFKNVSQKKNGAVKAEQSSAPTTKSFKQKNAQKASLESEKQASQPKIKKSDSIIEKEEHENELELQKKPSQKEEKPLKKEEKPLKKEEKIEKKKEKPQQQKQQEQEKQSQPENERRTSLLALMGKNKLQDAVSDDEIEAEDDLIKGENSPLNSTKNTAQADSKGKKEDQDTSLVKSFKKKSKTADESVHDLVDRLLLSDPEPEPEDIEEKEEEEKTSFFPVISQDLRKKPTVQTKTTDDILKDQLPKTKGTKKEDPEEEQDSLSIFSKRITRKGTNEGIQADKKQVKKEEKAQRKPKEEEQVIMEISTTKDDDNKRRTRVKKTSDDFLDGLPLSKSKYKDEEKPKRSQRKSNNDIQIEESRSKSKRKNYESDEEDEDYGSARKSKRVQKKNLHHSDSEEEKPKKRGRKTKDSMEIEVPKEEKKTTRTNKKEKVDPLMTRLEKMSKEIATNFENFDDSEEEVRLTKAKGNNEKTSTRGRKPKNTVTPKEDESDEDNEKPRRKKETKAAAKKGSKTKLAEKQDKKTKAKSKAAVVSDDESDQKEDEEHETNQTSMEIEKPKKTAKTKATEKKPESEPKKRGRKSAQKDQDDEEVVEKKLKTETSKPKPAPVVERATPVRSSRRNKKDEDPSDLDLNLTKRNAYKVLFSGFDPVDDAKKVEDAKRKLKSIGVKVTDDKDNFNVLILGRFIRSVKFLLAVSKGISIVSIDWVFDCAADGKALPPDDYLIDDETTKSNFDFPLSKTLEKVRRSDRDLLRDYTFWIPNNIKPSHDDLKTLIESMKGTVVKTKPSRFKENLLIILNEGDEKQADHFIELGFKAYTTELIYSGILHQKLKLTHNLIK